MKLLLLILVVVVFTINATGKYKKKLMMHLTAKIFLLLLKAKQSPASYKLISYDQFVTQFYQATKFYILRAFKKIFFITLFYYTCLHTARLKTWWD